PMHLFIHGGYWRALTKEEHSFVAAGLVPAGATVAVNSYDLCPAVTLDTIIEQCRQAVVWCWTHAADYGADRDRLFVSGHSAGGHLTAMMLATDWTRYGLPADAIKGVTPISGLFDLEPLRLAYINEWIQLEAADVPRVSPVHNPPPPRPGKSAPVTISYGTKDPIEFGPQADAYLKSLADNGIEADLYVQGGADHFAAAFCLRDPTSPLARLIQAQMGL
ncbi:MAG: alpha/beta hydrolase, partial [Rhodospirillaceae bacterium]|nr:alpha/beta hydrolase [Rhodospirillaceae bacterium]